MFIILHFWMTTELSYTFRLTIELLLNDWLVWRTRTPLRSASKGGGGGGKQTSSHAFDFRLMEPS